MNYTVSISARSKPLPIQQFIQNSFREYSDNIDSVFGFTAFCKLYGGRSFNGTEITKGDLSWMYDNNIGYRIPLTNLLVTRQDYLDSKVFLDIHHRAGNSVIVAKSDLASWIREDFPKYQIEQSVISRVKSANRLSLDLYDTIVPDPSWINNNLDDIPSEYRHRIRLFLNAGCMYKCVHRRCYSSFSRMHLGIDNKFECDQQIDNYKHTHMHQFDLQTFLDKGYSKFKVLRSNGITGY